MKYLSCLLAIYCSAPLYAYSFHEALRNAVNHPRVQVVHQEVQALAEKAEAESSWGDPMLMLSAMNFPVESLELDASPMTGIELGISQKIPLTSKYAKIAASFEAKTTGMGWQRVVTTRELQKNAWNVMISLAQVAEEQAILKESIQWVDDQIDITKQLYVNGQVSQQAVLDIQVRKAELQSSLQSKVFMEKRLQKELAYLLGQPESATVGIQSAPWQVLRNSSKETKADPLEKRLEADVAALAYMSQAKSLARIPDVTIGVGYTKRSDSDTMGDFVGASLTIPLPISGKRWAERAEAVSSLKAQEYALADFRRKRHLDITNSELLQEQVTAELAILKEESQRFARAARDSVSKAYGIGNAGYPELLTAELKLQTLLLTASELQAQLRKTQLQLKYLKGERLW